MKTLKTTLVIVSLFFSLSLIAQPPGGGQGRDQQGPPPLPNAEEIEEMVAELSDYIEMSKSQESKVLTLYSEHFDMVKEKLSSGRPNREYMESLEADFQKEVKAVLDDEQIEKYEAYLKEQKAKKRR